MTNVAQAQEGLRQVKDYAEDGDNERAHIAQDDLLKFAVQVAAAGAPDAQEVAHIAMEATQVKFQRWYA